MTADTAGGSGPATGKTGAPAGQVVAPTTDAAARSVAGVPRGFLQSERVRRWGSHVLYLAAINVLFVNSSPLLFVETWQNVLLVVLVPLVVAGILLRVRLPYLLPLSGILGIVAGTFAVFIVGMTSLATRRGGRSVWALATGGAMAAAVVIARRDVADGADLSQVVVGILIVFAVVGFAPAIVGSYIRAHRALAESMVEQAVRAEYERELSAQQAVHTERERIAQDMHDSLGHVLALITMQAGALEVQSKDAEAVEAASQIRQTARSGLVELRSVVHALGDDERRDPTPGLEAVPDLVAASTRAGAEVHLSDRRPPEQDAPPPALGRVAHQTVQEGLTNAHRHAPGAPVDVVVSGSPGTQLEVTVSNPLGPGGIRGAGTGLDRLRKRVEVLGGTLDAHTAHGRFDLSLRLPWEDRQ